MSLINELLLDRMSKGKAAELQGYLSMNYPSPKWVEELLQQLRKNQTVENVLTLIRDDPGQTMRHCTNLSVGIYFETIGMAADFKKAGATKSFDLTADKIIDVEVKHLDDGSNWALLSRGISEIPSSYLVNVITDMELTPRQIDAILGSIEEAVTSRSEATFVVTTPAAELHFQRFGSSRRTLSILTSRTFGLDIPALRRLFSSRIEDAKAQLQKSELLRFAAIDIDRPKFFTDSVVDIFCGTLHWQIPLPWAKSQSVGSYRSKDGILYGQSLWEGIDGILLFYGYDRGARRIAYFRSPGVPGSQFPAKLGESYYCSS